MRPRTLAPVLLAVLLPACLSGFAEVRIAGNDASAPGDRPAADRPLADAPGAPDGAQDAPALDVVALDAPADVSGPQDTPEDRAAPDAGDVVDVPAPEDARDAVGALDVVDASELRDVVVPEDRATGDVADAPVPVDAGPPRDCGIGFSDCAGNCAFLYGAELNCGRCGNSCAPGDLCIRGTCSAPTRFVGAVTFSATEYARDANAVIRWDALCAGRYGSSARVCTSYEVPRGGEGERACAAIGDPDGGIRQAALAMPAPFLVARVDGSFAFFALVCRGAMADSRGAWDGPTVAACCAP